MGKISARRVLAASVVVGALAAPGIAQARPKPSIHTVQISSANRKGSRFKVSVQAAHTNSAAICVSAADMTICGGYATRHGSWFSETFYIAGARRSSHIEYGITAWGPGGKRFLSGSLAENSGTGTTSIG